MISRRTVIAGALVAGTTTRLPAAPPTAAGRQVLAFYYPWYANPATSGRWLHWQGPAREAPRQSPTVNTPTLGMYDSHDPAVITRHAAMMRRAGITAAVVSWWGAGSFEDEAMPRLLDSFHRHGIAVTAYLERQRDGVAGARRDVAALMRYADHPAWLKVGTRPVVFLYLQALRDLDAKDWRAAAGPRPFLVGDVSPRETAQFAAWAPYMDGIHVYVLAPYVAGMAPRQMHAWADRTYPAWRRSIAPRLFCATVIPGFDDTLVPGRPQPRPTVPRHGGRTYEVLWDAAIRHRADWVVVTSFNEWHEGSEIEPSRQYGTHYLDLTATATRRFRALS